MRVTATYLMRELYKQKEEEVVPINLSEIEGLYSTMQSLNENMVRRIRNAALGDGSLNAIIILSSFSSLIPIILKDELKRLKTFFI